MPIAVFRHFPRSAALCIALVAVALIPRPADEALSRRMASAQASGEAAPPSEAGGAQTTARVRLGPRGRDLRLAGDLMEGVSAEVEALVSAHPEVERIHLTSGGGLVEEGLALGALVARHRLATYVPDQCASACTLVFVRGRERYLATGARLGFHAPYEVGPSGQSVAVDAAPERAAYGAAGIAPDFTSQALAVSSDDLWIPDDARLLRAGVVTQIVETDRFPDSTLDEDASPQAARAQVLNTLPILAGVDPASLDRLAAWYRDGYMDGRSEADALEGLRAWAAAHLRQLFRHADDATIRALGHAALTALREADTADQGACEAIAGGDFVVTEETLRSATHPVPSLVALIAQARRSGETAGAATAVVLPGAARPRRFASGGSGRCGPRIEALQSALTHPLPETASILRRLMLDEARRDEVVGIADR